jgi:hypothetical protein
MTRLDAHGGWPIFTPPAELGIHTAGASDPAATGAPSGHQRLYLMCGDRLGHSSLRWL